MKYSRALKGYIIANLEMSEDVEKLNIFTISKKIVLYRNKR